MSEIILYKSPLKALRLIALSSVFVIPCSYFVYKGKNDWQLILSICFFSLGYIPGFFHLLDRRPQIVINTKGIWDRTLKLNTIPWHYIFDAYSITINKQDFICLVTDDKIANKKKIDKWAKTLNEDIGAQKINLNLSAVKANADTITSQILQLINESDEGRSDLINKFKNT